MYILIFFRLGITVPSSITVGHMWQILGRGRILNILIILNMIKLNYTSKTFADILS